MDYKKSYYLSRYGLFVSLLILFIAYQINENHILRNILVAIGIISVIINILQEIVFCCCPFCGYHFSTRDDLPKYCPECGRKLE
ncbi:hypothetical protein AAK894_09385 [Lachnospiraceae bacterium 46-61]